MVKEIARKIEIPEGVSVSFSQDVFTAMLVRGGILALLSTVVIFLLVVYVESTRIEIPLAHSAVRGARGRFPVKLIYASVLPMILVRALQANIQMIGIILASRGITFLGEFHAGSLDPKVTGLLPALLGRATKAVPALRLSGKEYVCLLKLHKEMPQKLVRKVCEEFTGPIYQMPPIKSAVKRVIRIRTIYYLEVLEIEGSFVLFRVGCEAGTYIRKLCHGAILSFAALQYQSRN